MKRWPTEPVAPRTPRFWHNNQLVKCLACRGMDDGPHFFSGNFVAILDGHEAIGCGLKNRTTQRRDLYRRWGCVTRLKRSVCSIRISPALIHTCIMPSEKDVRLSEVQGLLTAGLAGARLNQGSPVSDDCASTYSTPHSIPISTCK